MRRVRLVTVVGVALALSACDWGPRGHGQLSGIVTSGAIPVGAIVLEVSGQGVQGFSDSGQTRVFFAEPETDMYRVVLVTSDPDSPLSLRLEVLSGSARGTCGTKSPCSSAATAREPLNSTRTVTLRPRASGPSRRHAH